MYASVALAPENIYTVYTDLTSQHASYYDIDRTLRLVVLLDDWMSCYTALGALHQLWQAVPIALMIIFLCHVTTCIVRCIQQSLSAMGSTSRSGCVQRRWIRCRRSAFLRAGCMPVHTLWEKGIAEKIDALSENIRETASADYQDAGSDGSQRR